MKKVRHFSEPFAAVPIDAMKSPAWRWLAPFARCVVLALAGQFHARKDGGSNNANLELTEAQAAEFGISRRSLYAGLGLATIAGFVKCTVPARQKAGKGIPAKFLLTWHRVSANSALNISEMPAARTWEKFAPMPPVRSLNQAEKLLHPAAVARPKRVFLREPKPAKKSLRSVARSPKRKSVVPPVGDRLSPAWGTGK